MQFFIPAMNSDTRAAEELRKKHYPSNGRKCCKQSKNSTHMRKLIQKISLGVLAFAMALIASGFALNVSALAANPDGFEMGNGLYSQGKFKEARQAYESLIESGN